ncbi:MAG: NPCBM/NEW2 domain-containing protein [Planctomycetes bacterium]|nr:NPCBM/NEW2 domain-containing protein [Planctomycetota bacterium]
MLPSLAIFAALTTPIQNAAADAAKRNLQLIYQPVTGPQIHDGWNEFTIDEFRIGDSPVVWPLEATIEPLLYTSARPADGIEVTAFVLDAQKKTHQIHLIAQAKTMICDITGLAPGEPYVFKIKVHSKRPLLRMYSTTTAPISPETMQTIMGEPEVQCDVAYDPVRDLALFIEPRGFGYISKRDPDESRWLEWHGVATSKGEANSCVLNFSYFSMCQQLSIPASGTDFAHGSHAPSGWRFSDVSGMNEAQILADARAVQESFGKYGLQYLIIGDGWQSPGSEPGVARVWNADSKRFPAGLDSLALNIKKLGLRPGIWMIPQSAETPPDDEGLLRQSDGLIVRDEILGAGIWNPSSARGRAKIAESAVSTIKKGFEYIEFGAQVEFLNIYKNIEREIPDKTNVEPDYAATLADIRRLAGPGVVFANDWGGRPLPGAPFAPTSGFTSFDIYKMGKSHGSDASSFRDAGNSVARGARVNGNLVWSDPDSIRVGEGISLNQARAWLSAVSLSGQTMFFNEKPGDLSAERKELISRALPPLPIRNMYVPSPINEVAALAFWSEKEGETRLIIGYFNWFTKGSPIESWHFDDATLRFLADSEKFDFWGNRFIGRYDISKSAGIELPDSSCAVIAARRARPNPFVISSNRHISQGILEISGEKYDDATRTLSGTSEVIAGDAYELRIVIPDMNWQMSQFDASGAGITQSQEGRLIRVAWKPAATGPVQWKAKFTKIDGPSTNKPNEEEVSQLKGHSGHGPSVHLSWTAAKMNSGLFVITRDGVQVGTTLVDSFVDRDQNLVFGKSHEYQVFPVDADGVIGKYEKMEVKVTQPPRVTLKELGWAARRSAAPIVVDGANVKGSPLTMEGKTYKEGIGVSPPTILDFQLKGVYGTFSAGIGIDDCTGGKGSALVRVLVDGKELGRAGNLKGGEHPRLISIRIPSGGQTLTIEVQDGGDGWSFDYVDIVDPEIRFTKQPK